MIMIFKPLAFGADPEHFNRVSQHFEPVSGRIHCGGAGIASQPYRIDLLASDAKQMMMVFKSG